MVTRPLLGGPAVGLHTYVRTRPVHRSSALVGCRRYRAGMLRAVDPPAVSNGPPPAYPVPFRFDRSDAPRYALTNASLETLRGVTFALIGSGRMPAQTPITLRPAATTVLTIVGDDLASNTILVVRWRRENGDEYLWRVSF